MNWKETFYTGKREHPQEKKPASLTALLMPSLLGTEQLRLFYNSFFVSLTFLDFYNL